MTPMTADEIANWLRARIAKEVGISVDKIQIDEPFVAFGIDSAGAVMIAADLEAHVRTKIHPGLLWDFPDVGSLARYVAEQVNTEAK